MLFLLLQARLLFLDPGPGSPKRFLLLLFSCPYPQLIFWIQFSLTIFALSLEGIHSVLSIFLNGIIHEVVSETFLLSSLNHQSLKVLV